MKQCFRQILIQISFNVCYRGTISYLLQQVSVLSKVIRWSPFLIQLRIYLSIALCHQPCYCIMYLRSLQLDSPLPCQPKGQDWNQIQWWILRNHKSQILSITSSVRLLVLLTSELPGFGLHHFYPLTSEVAFLQPFVRNHHQAIKELNCFISFIFHIVSYFF